MLNKVPKSDAFNVGEIRYYQDGPNEIEVQKVLDRRSFTYIATSNGVSGFGGSPWAAIVDLAETERFLRIAQQGKPKEGMSQACNHESFQTPMDDAIGRLKYCHKCGQGMD
jgi:hypothetical protein